MYLQLIWHSWPDVILHQSSLLLHLFPVQHLIILIIIQDFGRQTTRTNTGQELREKKKISSKENTA
jgi:hypothetical protein